MAKLFERTVDGIRLWYARCYYVTPEGKRDFKKRSTGVAVTGKQSEVNAQTIADDLESKISAGRGRSSRESRTLKQALAALVSDQETAERSDANLEIITQKSYHLLKFFGPDRRLHTIDEAAVKNYVKKAREAGRAATTVARELLVLRQAFGAVGQLVPKFPELGDPPPPRDRVLEVEEQQKLIMAVAPNRRLMLRTFLQVGGPRKSEIDKFVEIDWKTHEAHIQGTKTTNSIRKVPIPDELFVDLKAEFGKEGFHGFEPWVNIDRDLRKAAERAQIKTLSCNDLRRTYATHMARSGVDPLRLAALMGTSVKMLETVYARLEKQGDHMHAAVAQGVPTLFASKVDARPLAKTKKLARQRRARR